MFRDLGWAAWGGGLDPFKPHLRQRASKLPLLRKRVLLTAQGG